MTCRGGDTRVWLTAISFIMATFDLVSDWVNYLDFSRSKFPDQADWDERYVRPMRLIVYISSGLYVGELLLLVAKWKAPKSNWTRGFGCLVTVLLWTIEDLGTISLVTAVYATGYCPLIMQYRTIPGRIALLAAGVSLVYKMILACIVYRGGLVVLLALLFSDDDGCKGYVGKGVMILVFVLVGFTLSMAVWCFNHVFKPVPSFNQPFHVTQQIDARFYLHRGYIRSRRLSTPGAVPRPSYRKLLPRNVSCSGFTHRLSFGNVGDLQASGELSKRLPCREASPFYEHFLQPAHAYMVHKTVSCTMAFVMKYSQENSELLYYMGYQLLQFDGSCINGKLRNQSVMIPAAEVWRHQALSDAIWRKECGKRFCPRREGLWSDTSTPVSRRKLPYYSCKSTGCEGVGNQSQIEPLPAWLRNEKISVNGPVFQITKENYPCHVVSRFEALLASNMTCVAHNTTRLTPEVTSTFSYCARKKFISW